MHKWIKSLVAGSMLLGVSTTASALSTYVAPMNAALGTTGLSCEACHAGYPAVAPSRTTITLPMGLTQAARLPLDTTDSDQDGFTNAQEASGTLLDFNSPAITPFTKAVATTNDVRLANVFVQGDAQATEFTITDIYTQAGISLPTGKELLGGATAASGVAVDIYATPSATAPVTLLFKAGAPDAAATVYVIDTYAQTNTPLVSSTDWVIAPNGGVQIKSLPSGIATPARIAVVRTIPAPANNVLGGAGNNPIGGFFGGEGNENEGGEGNGNGQVGCLSSSSTLPVMMGLLLLMMGVLLRKRS